MGKATGFLEYARKENPFRDAKERLSDYEDLHIPQPAEERTCQASRCMNCGVPFCQSSFGCPLHNLIPEWNDLLCRGLEREALERLLQTAPFPEFTGRVCPALCEKACNLGDEGVTNRDNELYLIEKGFEQGWIHRRVPAQRSGKYIAVIGSGPSGLAAADLLNRLGHHVTVIERAEKPGGLLMYGIPNMKLPKEIVERRIRLMEADVPPEPGSGSGGTGGIRRRGAVRRFPETPFPERGAYGRGGRPFRGGFPDGNHEKAAGRKGPSPGEGTPCAGGGRRRYGQRLRGHGAAAGVRLCDPAGNDAGAAGGPDPRESLAGMAPDPADGLWTAGSEGGPGLRPADLRNHGETDPDGCGEPDYGGGNREAVRGFPDVPDGAAEMEIDPVLQVRAEHAHGFFQFQRSPAHIFIFRRFQCKRDIRFQGF